MKNALYKCNSSFIIPASNGVTVYNEQTATEKYLEERNFNELVITACVQCGLIINTEAPWLGGSPDCLLHDSV